MNGLPLCSSNQIISALRKDGFYPKSKFKRGSHQTFMKELPDGHKRIVTIPFGRKEIPRGTLASILRQAGLARDKFLELL